MPFCQNKIIYWQRHYPRRLWNYKDFQEMQVFVTPQSVAPWGGFRQKEKPESVHNTERKGGGREILILHLAWQDNQHLKRADLFFITDHLLLSLSSTTPLRILVAFLVSSMIYNSYSECLYLFIWRIIQWVEVGKVWTKMTPLSSGEIRFVYSSSTSPVGMVSLKDDEGE